MKERIIIMVQDADGNRISGAQVHFLKDRYIKDEDGAICIATDCHASISALNPLIMDSNGLSSPLTENIANT